MLQENVKLRPLSYEKVLEVLQEYITPKLLSSKMKLELTTLVAIGVATTTLASGPAAITRSRRPFGVNKTSTQTKESVRTNIILGLRGGEVHESPTLPDLESKIQNAALTDKLTIIDFTATW